MDGLLCKLHFPLSLNLERNLCSLRRQLLCTVLGVLEVLGDPVPRHCGSWQVAPLCLRKSAKDFTQTRDSLLMVSIQKNTTKSNDLYLKSKTRRNVAEESSLDIIGTYFGLPCCSRSYGSATFDLLRVQSSGRTVTLKTSHDVCDSLISGSRRVQVQSLLLKLGRYSAVLTAVLAASAVLLPAAAMRLEVLSVDEVRIGWTRAVN